MPRVEAIWPSWRRPFGKKICVRGQRAAAEARALRRTPRLRRRVGLPLPKFTVRMPRMAERIETPPTMKG
jgi:hypothetical protein